MKKLIGLILAVCMFCTGIAYADNYGVISNTMDENATMTRAEMAQVVATLRGTKIAASVAKDDIIFDDVDSEHPQSRYIKIAKELKVIEGNGDGTFEPDKPVTFEQVVKMIVRTLGCEPMLKEGYPGGYITVATKLGLTKGIIAEPGQPIMIKDIRKIIDKALTTPIMQQTAFGDIVEYQISNGEDGANFNTLETLYFNPSPFYITDKDNNIILTYKDIKTVVGALDDTKKLYALEFNLSDEGRKKLEKATEEISKAPQGENYVKVIASDGSVVPSIILKPNVMAKIDSGKFIVTGIEQLKAESIIKEIKNYNVQ